MSEPETSQVFRVFWIPGTDFLRATCHCTAERIFDDPIELWTWLLEHPRGHDIGGPAQTPPDAVHPEGQLSGARQ
ncbi:MAG TPA: hypothetical protein VLL08_00590 [Kineosporiaceae bacterium]|nr:hypothetical protein [Kineosporiaceae bacterium]